MAKAAKIFAVQTTAGTSSAYTVPVGKYAVVNCFGGGAGDASIKINGVSVGPYTPTGGVPSPINGIVCPAGTTISAFIQSTGAVFAAGFEYDV